MMQIEIDEQKCQSPQECRKCVLACPEGIFLNYTRDVSAQGKNARNWVIVPVFKSLCTGCKVCEEVCPEKAVTVSVVA